MRAATTVSTGCLALVVALAAPPGLSAQEDAAPVFRETVDVRVVNVEVVVTDKQGRRVRGLAPGDFLLTVDGEPTAIEYFTEIDDAEARAVAARGPEAAGAPVPAAPPGAVVGTHYLVFVDEYFSIGAHRDFAIERLGEQLALLGRADRVAIVAFAGGRVERLCGWTAATEALEECIAAALERPTYGLFRVSERSRRGIAAPGAGAYAAREIELELERVNRAAAATMRAFPRPPGRAVLILLAGGWPSFDVPSSITSDSWYRSDLDILDRLAGTANLLGYTLYPLDLPGLRTTGVDASQGEPSPLDQPSPVSAEIIRQSGLRALAERTGGRALLYADRARPLAAVVEDTRSYYWLGFTPRRSGDDRPRRIEVEVRGERLRVRARRTFLDISPAAEQEMVVESALLFGDAGAGEADFAVQVGAPERAGRRRVRLPLTVELPLWRLSFLPRGGAWAADVELRLGTRDERGNTSAVLVLPLHLEGPEEPAAGATRLYRADIVMRRGEHDLVVTLYDTVADTVLTSWVEVAP